MRVFNIDARSSSLVIKEISAHIQPPLPPAATSEAHREKARETFISVRYLVASTNIVIIPVSSYQVCYVCILLFQCDENVASLVVKA